MPFHQSTHQGGVIGVCCESGGLNLRLLRAILVVAGLLLAGLLAALSGAPPASAVEAVNVRSDASAIDLTAAVELQRTETDRIQISTAPSTDGTVHRIEFRAREGNTNWAVFALANSGNEQLDRLIVVPHYRLVGSGLMWPDLGLSRAAVVASRGAPPARGQSPTGTAHTGTRGRGAWLLV